MKQTRRDFIKNAALSAAGFTILPAWAAGSGKPPSSKLNVAFIGVGGRGEWACQDLCTFEKVNPVCFVDVDDKNAANTYKKFPNVPHMRDYRQMFDKYGKDIDAVVISTPDHAHFPIAAWAMLNGKHVYDEKPMTRTIWESRELAKIAKKTGVVTQLGNQGHTIGPWRNVREWYKNGIIGEVKEMHIWTDRPVWRQGPKFPRPDGSEKVPPTLDFKLWLNVAPDTKYSSNIVPFHWRGLRDYGTGAMGDHACHVFDWVYSPLELGMPVKIKGTSDPFDDFSWPLHSRTEFEFAPKGSRPAVKMYWYDTSLRPKNIPRVPQEVVDTTPNGAVIVGTKETVMCFDQFGARTIISPRDRMIELKKSNALPPDVPTEKSHHRNWVEACLAGKKANSDIVDYAADLNEFVLLGCIPIHFPGEELVYDHSTRLFTNKEANKFFNSHYEYKQEFLPYKI